MVSLAALKAKAFTAAHGAVFCAQVNGLPFPIVCDLQDTLMRSASISDEGKFPEEENSDPRWRELLPLMWHPHKDIVVLCWAEYQGAIWVFPKYAIGPASAFSQGEGSEVWDRFPLAKEKALQLYDETTLLSSDPIPEMLPAYQGIYLSAAMHINGVFPEMEVRDTLFFSTNNGWMLYVIRNKGHYCLIQEQALVDQLNCILKTIFEGMFHLSGPDRELEQVFTMVNIQLPF